MKLYLKIFILLIPFSLFSQEENKENVFIYIKSNSFFGHKGNYRVHFSLKNNDINFKNDIYNFNISDYTLKERNIFDLGTEIDIDTLSYITPSKYFKNTPPCDVHEWLSKLPKENNIYIVTKVPPSIKGKKLGGKFLYWKAQYISTSKGAVPTQLGRGPFYTGR